MVKEGSSCLGKILNDNDNDNVILLWNFRNNSKIQRKVLKELNKEENNKYTPEQVEIAFTALQVFIFKGYILPEIKDPEIKLNFEKLPLELQERIVKDFGALPQEQTIEDISIEATTSGDVLALEGISAGSAIISGNTSAYNDIADSSN